MLLVLCRLNRLSCRRTLFAAERLSSSTRERVLDLDGVRGCFTKLSACYAKAGVAERFRGRLYDAPPEFNAEMQQEAWEWLARWL